MVKVDTSLWNNPKRMRERLKNLGTMILSITAVNGFYLLSQKSWILFSINVLFFVTTIPLFISYGRWSKQPPMEEQNV